MAWGANFAPAQVANEVARRVNGEVVFPALSFCQVAHVLHLAMIHCRSLQQSLPPISLTAHGRVLTAHDREPGSFLSQKWQRMAHKFPADYLPS